jgi:hypothetical protein
MSPLALDYQDWCAQSCVLFHGGVVRNQRTKCVALPTMLLLLPHLLAKFVVELNDLGPLVQSNLPIEKWHFLLFATLIVDHSMMVHCATMMRPTMRLVSYVFFGFGVLPW